MAVKLSTVREKKTRDIEVEGEKVTVYYQSPTAHEWVEDENIFVGSYYNDYKDLDEAMSKRRWHRVRTTICGWENVVADNDKPVPFAFERLVELMTQSREFHVGVCNLVDEIYTGADRKNSSSPSETNSTDGESKALNSENSSDDETSS